MIFEKFFLNPVCISITDDYVLVKTIKNAKKYQHILSVLILKYILHNVCYVNQSL